MTEGVFADESVELLVGLHRLLLRLAGRVPDELVTHARTLLGEGELAWLPDTVMGSAVELSVPLAASDVALLRRTVRSLGTPGGEPTGLDRVSISDDPPQVNHRFAPAPPDVLAVAGERIPVRLDLTGGDPDDLADLPADLSALDDIADELTDEYDDVALVNMSRHAGVVGIWRAWRFGGDGPFVSGRRVYLVEVEPGVEAWTLVVDAQRALAQMGELSPQVEMYWTDDGLPPYQREALAHSARFWSRGRS